MADVDRLCLNQVTVLQQWSLPQFLDGVRRHDIRTISIWRDKLKETGTADAARRLSGSGLTVWSLCAAGLLTTPDATEAAAAADELRRAIDDTAAIGAKCLMFVAGGMDPRDKDIAATRARVVARLAAIAPYARSARVKLALEPLHPMVCGARSVLSTLKLANDWCDLLAADDVFGIAIDTYAVWWDPDVAVEIARAGKRIIAFHLADWLADTRDLRLDRGMPGDGVVDFPGLRSKIEATGYAGPLEVEIFSATNWWQRDPDEVIRTVKDRIRTVV